jgi:thiamine-monophosphate kinase
MKLSQIGEFGLIEILKKAESGKQRVDTIVGIGDDAAVIKIKDKYLLITTDSFIENVHFNLKNITFFNLGFKALAASISDIAAMGGWPTHAFVTIGLPKKIRVEQIKQLYAGINALAGKHKIDIIGGDTIASPKEVVISITLLGEVEKDNLLLRSGAKIGDAILVTGNFGGPAAHKYVARKPSPVTHIKEARVIASSHLATAMIDSSDGLVRSVIELCKASKTGARLWLDSVPAAKEATLDNALYGGEEYELVLTVPRSKAARLKALIQKKTKARVTIVGEMVAGKRGIKLVDIHGRITLPASGGYEHFK